MTDRIIAVLVEHENDKCDASHESALSLMYAVDSVTLMDGHVFVIFEHDIRDDDFETFEDAFNLFGFVIREKFINDGSLAMLRGSAISGARYDMINDHIAKRPKLDPTGNVTSILRQYIIDMAGWSYVMKKIMEIDFKE